MHQPLPGSSGGRKPTDPKFKPQVAASPTSRSPVTRSPWAQLVPRRRRGSGRRRLSPNLKQLQGIFSCKITNWKQVGGKNGAIKVFLPQPGSGTLSTWEKFMNITTGNPAACVTSAVGKVGIEENEGVNKVYNSPNAIGIYSVGAFVSQKYHSAGCASKPAGTQNKFGCNVTGFPGDRQDQWHRADHHCAKVARRHQPQVPEPRVLAHGLQRGSLHAAATKDQHQQEARGHEGSARRPVLTPARAAPPPRPIIKNYGFVPYAFCGTKPSLTSLVPSDPAACRRSLRPVARDSEKAPPASRRGALFVASR